MAGVRGLRNRLTFAEHDDAQRHSGNRTNDLRGNPARKGNPGGTDFLTFSQPIGGLNRLHNLTFAPVAAKGMPLIRGAEPP
jgi:hypothetical protein